jgi:DNA-binding beta-propeller fold protein YncE
MRSIPRRVGAPGFHWTPGVAAWATLFASLCIAPALTATAVSSPPRHAAGDDREQQTVVREDGREGTVWVLNRDRGELTIFEAWSGQVIETIAVGAGAHDICIAEQAHKAYITAETVNAVTTVDTKTLAVASIPVGPLPHHIEPSHDGRTVYVSLASHTATVGVPALAVIDTSDDTVTYVATSRNPAARAHAPRPTVEGETVYVAHDLGDEVTAIATRSSDIGLSVGNILKAEEVVPTRFGRWLWASSRGDGSVKRIDLRTLTITGSIPVGAQPESMMLTPSEKTLVVSLRGSPATLAFVDTARLKLLGTVEIGGPGTFGDLGVISGDGRFVYATFDAGAGGTGGVAVVDVDKREVVDTWAYPGTGRPHGIWYSRRSLR